MDRKKYEFTGKTTQMYGGRVTKTLRQIRALVDIETSIGVVKKGTDGGYIEKEMNLSHFGNSWVYPGAYVFDDAKVEDNAIVYQQAKVNGKAYIFQNAKVYGCATVSGKAVVYGNARISEHCLIDGNASIYEDATINGRSVILGKSVIAGHALILDNARIFGNARVTGHAIVRDNTLVYGNAFVTGECVDIRDRAVIAGNAWIMSNNDYVYINGVGHEPNGMNSITAHISQGNTIEVICPDISTECKNIDKFIDFVECEMCDSDYKASFMSALMHAKTHLSRSLTNINAINTPKKAKVTKVKSIKSNKCDTTTECIDKYDPVEDMVRTIVNKQLLPYEIGCDEKYGLNADSVENNLTTYATMYQNWLNDSSSETELILKIYNHYSDDLHNAGLSAISKVYKVDQLSNAIMEIYGKPKFHIEVDGVRYEKAE